MVWRMWGMYKKKCKNGIKNCEKGRKEYEVSTKNGRNIQKNVRSVKIIWEGTENVKMTQKCEKSTKNIRYEKTKRYMFFS